MRNWATREAYGTPSPGAFELPDDGFAYGPVSIAYIFGRRPQESVREYHLDRAARKNERP